MIRDEFGDLVSPRDVLDELDLRDAPILPKPPRNRQHPPARPKVDEHGYDRDGTYYPEADGRWSA